MRTDWLYIKGACRMVSFEENLPEWFSGYSFALEVRLEMERRLACVRLKHIKQVAGAATEGECFLTVTHKGRP